MSIDRTQKISPASLPEVHRERGSRENRRASLTSTACTGTRVSLNNQVRQLQTDDTHDLNYARLDRIKSALATGELPVDADKISQSLVRDMFDLF